MEYSERREVYKQISQLLADAGLNQGTIKTIIEGEIQNKVSRAIDQVILNLNAQSSSDNYIADRINEYMKSPNMYHFINDYVKREILPKKVYVELKDVDTLNSGLRANPEKKKIVEDFLTLFSDPVEASKHFSGEIEEKINEMINELNADENAMKMFTHTMAYLFILAELYYNSSCV